MSLASGQALACGEPLCTRRAEFLSSTRFVRRYIRSGEGIFPVTINPLMNEHLGASVPEGPAQRHALGGVLHASVSTMRFVSNEVMIWYLYHYRCGKGCPLV